MSEAILVINAGSSSVKFCAYAKRNAEELGLLFKGQLDGIGTRPRLVVREATNVAAIDTKFDQAAVNSHETAFREIAEWLRSMSGRMPLVGVGHRVVHGGPDFVRPTVIEDAVVENLDRLAPLAPLHQPPNLAAIRAVQRHFPNLPQVACFDTAFHRTHPALADHFALPKSLYEAGVRRYGFHGLSYEYIAQKLPKVAPALAQGRVVVAHLGSGASMCAMKAGVSIDSTMSFSALDGLPMGTRCGALDPGAVIHLIRERGMTVGAVEALLYRESGLRGLSGLSNDVRDLEASDSPAARFALDYFVYRACRELGALAAVLGGIDGIVFTAGIGEHAPEIRAAICNGSAWLGLELDRSANRAGGPCITTGHSPVSAWIIPTDEELVIAQHTSRLLSR